MLECSIRVFSRTCFSPTKLLIALSARERAAETVPQPCSIIGLCYTVSKRKNYLNHPSGINVRGMRKRFSRREMRGYGVIVELRSHRKNLRRMWAGLKALCAARRENMVQMPRQTCPGKPLLADAKPRGIMTQRFGVIDRTQSEPPRSSHRSSYP